MSPKSHEFSREEPIPGYTTTELIGRGGFGEVWRAVAPGGVPKAIKLVFGDDPSRSELELRSLNRIKDVRHPLILSIDRIEVVNRTLVIVTELGDCNLKEFCQQFRNQGHVGIPQQELLNLIHDAAEALDYIYAEHSLQHLDVKPENFLLFGKHLKIADFGVVKHIYERAASLVHGMTPIYSAPESLGGKPSRYTDQYGLAIVYQEMLTGQLPFDGISPGRLATQHLMEPPNLEALPQRQQPIVARALSKDPHQRFESCVAFVEELERSVNKPEPPPRSPESSSDAPRNQVIGTRPAADAREELHSKPKPKPPSVDSLPAEIESLNAHLEAIFDAIDQGVDAMPPTVLVGIGGTAALVMHQLRLRINDRLGQLRTAPSIKLLAIDSDVRQLNQIHRDENVWKEIETIAVPLRKSEEYRAQHAQLKRWINRRWLYNIPRDQSTDGIRALGRLAMVTNFSRMMSSIERAIRESSSNESAVQSSESLEIPFVPGRPRVILVASTTGGTGGGMLFDVAYGIRGKLKQAGYENDQIEAVLLHSTPRKGQDQAIANTYATLEELKHFSRRGNYFPGDSNLGIEAFHGNNRTFAQIDFLHLGDSLEKQQWKEAADDAAEFLYCSLFGHPRKSFPPSNDEAVVVRSVSVEQLGAANRRFLSEFSLQICQDVLEGWCGRELTESTDVAFTETTKLLNQLANANASKHRRLGEALEQKFADLNLGVHAIKTRLRGILHQELGKPPEDYLESLIREVLDFGAEKKNAPKACLAALDRVLSAGDSHDVDMDGANTLHAVLTARSENLAHKLAAELRTWLQDLVNDPGARVDGAQYAAEKVHGQLQDLLASVVRDRADNRAKMDGIKVKSSNFQHPVEQRRSWIPFRSPPPVETLESVLFEYGTAKLDQIILSVVYKLLRTIDAQVGATIDQTQRLLHDLARLSRKFETLGKLDSPGNGSQSFDDSVAWYVQNVRERLLAQRMEIVGDLDGMIGKSLAGLGFTLKRFLDHPTDIADVLFLPLREVARDVVSGAVAAIHCTLIDGDFNAAGNAGTQPESFCLTDLIENLIRKHSENVPGDSGRIFVVIPKSADSARLESRLNAGGKKLAVVNAVTNGVTLLEQTENVSLGELIQSLTESREVYRELAERLHSREDVDWTPMDAPETGGPLLDLPDGVTLDKTAKLNR